MKRFDWVNLDYQRLATHLVGALLLAVGGAIVENKPILPAFTAWFGAALIYAGGAIQNFSKKETTDSDKS